ncbi:MAG: shikimate kinase [Candidatus Dormiibacterota bacterium]
MSRPIVLLGLMGSGKTTVGELLAQRLDRPFWDGDAQLEGMTGQSAARLSAERGADVLHRLEVEVLVRGLSNRPAQVVAAAAAVVLDPQVPSLLAETWVVWLRVEVAHLVSRLRHDDGHRPLPSGDLLGMLREMARVREPLYASLADLTVDSGRSTPAATVRRIVASLPAGS